MSVNYASMTGIADSIKRLHRGLVVSAQAAEGEPLCAPEHICALALSGLNGGACGLRLEGLENIQYVRSRTDVPIIGLTKASVPESDKLTSVYITGTFAEAMHLARAKADIIAIDATARSRPDGATVELLINRINSELHKPVWADVSTYEEGVAAALFGAAVVSTTMYGYTAQTQLPPEAPPNFELLSALCRDLDVPVVLEGRVWHPDEITRAFQTGVHAVVVGSAITRPQLITQRFVQAIPR